MIRRGFKLAKEVNVNVVPGPRARSMVRAARQRQGLPRSTGKGQVTVQHESGGYSTLHPTNGWRTFTPRRLAAIVLTARRLGRSTA